MPFRLRSRLRWFAAILLTPIIVSACGGTDDDATSADDSTEEAVPATSSSSTTSSTTSSSTTTSSTTAPPATTTITEPPARPTGDELRTRVETGLITASGTTDLVDRMAEQAVPGLAVTIVVDGEVVAAFAGGETPGGEPMSPSTVIQVGSVSKPVAAIAALSAAALDVVDLDTDVESLLTSYDLPAGAQSAAEPVTIAGLLAHDAGTNVDGFLGYATADEAPDRPGFLSGDGNTEALSVVRAPGSGFLYSGGGYELVAQTLVDTTGFDWDTLIADAVFTPAGMVDSFYALDLAADQAARASEGSVNGEVLGNRWQAHPEGAAAGLWTTADDLGALVAAFTQSLSGADETLLPTEWAQRAVTPIAEAPGIGATAQGFFVDSFDAPTRWFHNGRNIGYTAEIAGGIDGSYGVAVVTNGFPGGTDLAREIIATVEDELGVGS